MGKIGIEHLCKSCMSFMQYTDRPCPKCGFDEKWHYSSKEYIKISSILNERYLVGKLLKQNDSELIYIGWDLETSTKVMVRECYLKELVKRDSSTSNDIILNVASKQDYYDNFKCHYVESYNKLIEFGGLYGIVWTCDTVWCNNTAYIITEYIDYVTLDEYIEQRGGRISVYEILGILQPIVYSLKFIHDKGVYHSNINFENIVITSNGDALLWGFGILSMQNRGYSYECDVHDLCKVIYKIVCGPKYLNNITNYRETGRLDIPTETKSYIVNILNKGMASNGSTTYFSIEELYNDIFENGEYQSDLNNIDNMLNYGMDQFAMNEYDMQNIQNNPNQKLKRGKYNSYLLSGVAIVATIIVMCSSFFIKKDSDVEKINNSHASGKETFGQSTVVWENEEIDDIVRKELKKNEEDIITVDELKQIKELTIRKKDIANLNDLKYFTNLEVLIINNIHTLQDISALSKLTNLTELHITASELTDISCLSTLTKLKILNLSDNKQLSDISVVKKLVELTKLELNRCNITDVSGIETLTALRTLSLAGNKITKIDSLGQMSNLNRIDLAENGITDWSGVDNIARVVGRPYKLKVEFCYQRNVADYEGWLLHTWRRDPEYLDQDRDIKEDFLFQSSATTSTLKFEFDMVEDFFSFSLYMKDKPKVKDIDTNRDIEIPRTNGEVSIKVNVYEDGKKPIVIEK